MSASVAAIGGGATSFQPFHSSANLLPPFDFAGSSLVANCALQAQQKYQSRHSGSGGGNSLHNADGHLLRGLPFNQPNHDSTQRQGALFCRSGTWLEIVDRRTAEYDARRNHMSQPDYVRGTRKETSRFTILEFLSVAFGLVSIRGAESQLYLCMDNKGRLYGAPYENYTSECVFMEEMLENYYNLYSSCAYGTKRRPWYVALRRTGRPRKGRNARKKQKSSHFLVIHFDEISKSSSNSASPRHQLYATGGSRSDSTNWLRKFTSGWNKPPEPSASSSKLLQHNQLTLSEILSNSLSSKWPARKMYEQFKQKQYRKLQKLVTQPKVLPQGAKLPKDESTTYQNVDWDDETPVTSEEVRLFRQDQRRKRRLIREEKRRERRRLELESLRNHTRLRAPKR